MKLEANRSYTTDSYDDAWVAAVFGHKGERHYLGMVEGQPVLWTEDGKDCALGSPHNITEYPKQLKAYRCIKTGCIHLHKEMYTGWEKNYERIPHLDGPGIE